VFVPVAGTPVVRIGDERFSLEEFAQRGSVSYTQESYGYVSNSTVVVHADTELDRVLQAIVEYLK